MNFVRKCSIGIVALITAIAVYLMRKLIMLAPEITGVRPIVDVWLRLLLISMAVSIVFVYYFVKNNRLKNHLTVGLLSIFFTTSVLLILKNTPYSFGGTTGDPGFHIAYITKFAFANNFVDFYYKDLPSFYPPLYFYILGKLATLFDIAPYAMLKIGLVITLFLLPFLVYVFWSFLVGRNQAILIVAVLFFIEPFHKPSDYLSQLIFIPWWIIFISNGAHKKSNVWFVVIGGIIGSLIFQTFYYWFLIGGVSVFVDIAFQKIFLNFSNRQVLTKIKNKFVVLLSTALLSSYYWAPYIYSMWSNGGWNQLQARDFSLSNVFLAFPLFSFDLQGILLLIGAIHLVLTFRSDKVSFGLLSILLSTYLFMVIGYVAIIFDNPLKANIGMRLVPTILAISFLRCVGNLWKNKVWEKLKIGNGRFLFEVLLIIIALFIGQNYVHNIINEGVNAANETKYPEEFLRVFHDIFGYENQDKVMFADASYSGLATYLPIYTFVSPNAHYSHPAAIFYERIEFINKLAELDDATLFAAAIMNNKYSKIDYILLEPEGSFYRYKYGDDNFPFGRKSMTIYFSQSMFDDLFFDVNFDKYYFHVEQDFVGIIPHYDNNPIGELLSVKSGEIEEYRNLDSTRVNNFFNEFDGYLSIDFTN